MNYRKSTYSNPNGECAEIGSWRKAEASKANGNCTEIGSWCKAEASAHNGGCVEAGHGTAVIGVRDTKQEHLGEARTVLEFSPATWAAFTARLKAEG
jgi:hypothetical protein